MPQDSGTSVPFIASRELVGLDAARGEFAIRLAFGMPYQYGKDEWVCAVALEGLYPKVSDIHGHDSFQALMLAQNFAQTLLQDFVEKGGRLLDAPGGNTVDVGRLFGSGVLS
jgi:hypothetical protein